VQMTWYSAWKFMQISTGDVQLVVVDELSSAVDPAGEYHLIKRLHEARHGKTMAAITHLFGHLTKYADAILCMKDGRLVKQSTHPELVTRKGEHAKMWKSLT
jgi:ABC-type multidrug transport system fused ATPase/permease subunit